MEEAANAVSVYNKHICNLIFFSSLIIDFGLPTPSRPGLPISTLAHLCEVTSFAEGRMSGTGFVHLCGVHAKDPTGLTEPRKCGRHRCLDEYSRLG